MKDLTAKVLDRWDRLRRFYFKGVLANRVEQAQDEHRQILEAMRGRDLVALQTLVRQHNQGALQAYLSYLDASEPDAGGRARRRAGRPAHARLDDLTPVRQPRRPRSSNRRRRATPAR